VCRVVGSSFSNSLSGFWQFVVCFVPSPPSFSLPPYPVPSKKQKDRHLSKGISHGIDTT
jgi:hypothetical protein